MNIQLLLLFILIMYAESLYCNYCWGQKSIFFEKVRQIAADPDQIRYTYTCQGVTTLREFGEKWGLKRVPRNEFLCVVIQTTFQQLCNDFHQIWPRNVIGCPVDDEFIHPSMCLLAENVHTMKITMLKNDITQLGGDKTYKKKRKMVQGASAWQGLIVL